MPAKPIVTQAVGHMYEIGPTGDECIPSPSWLREFESKWACPKCGKLDRSVYDTGYDIVLETPPRPGALGWALSPLRMYRLINRGFACALLNDRSHDVVLGRVFACDGSERWNYATYIGRTPLAVRGGPASKRDVCDNCGTLCYYPLQSWYVLQASLSSQDVYQGIGISEDLIVSDSVFRSIDRKRWKGLQIHKLPVLDEPQDGIRNFPENWYCCDNRP